MNSNRVNEKGKVRKVGVGMKREFARPSPHPPLGLHMGITQLLSVCLTTAAGGGAQPSQQTDSSICEAPIL